MRRSLNFVTKCASLPVITLVSLALAGCSGAGGGASTPIGLSQALAATRNASEQTELYVANPTVNTVTVYPAQGSGKYRTISQGLIEPASLAFDASNNLYVANCGGCYDTSKSSVTVYAGGKSKLSRTITDGVVSPLSIVVDSTGNLYVANTGANTVTVYAPGSSTVSRTISSGISGPTRLAFDASGNLYVSNENNTVTVYGPGAGPSYARSPTA